MEEDAQPNEKSLYRKGAAVPVIRSTRSNNKRGIYKRSHDHRSSQRYLSTRPSNLGFSPSTISDYQSFSPWKAQKPEPTERFVNLSSECWNGVPRCQNPRKQWTPSRAHILADTKVQVRSKGLMNSAVRFICADDQAMLPVERETQSSNAKSMSMSNITDINNEIAAADQLADTYPEAAKTVSLPSSLDNEADDSPTDMQSPAVVGQALRNFRRSSQSYPVLTDTPVPLRVFTSGILSVSPSMASRPSAFPPTLVPQPISSTALIETRSPSTYRSGQNGSDSPLLHILPCVSKFQHQIEEYPTTTSPDAPPATDTLATASPCSVPVFSREIQATGSDEYTAQAHPSQYNPSHKLQLDGISIRIPLQQYNKDKSRRLLYSSTMSSLLNVSMRGSIDVIDFMPLRHRYSLTTPKPSDEVIDDACLLHIGSDVFTVLGHARDHGQLSWSRANAGGLNGTRLLNRPRNSNKRGGVSAVAPMMQPLQFVTGGYDHIVHLWNVRPDFSCASPRQLAIKHNAPVHSLLSVRDTSHKLVSAGADCNVHIWDLASERVVNTLRTSNTVYHAHSTVSPFCTLLEVAHRELQFEVRDHRLVPEQPVQRFGHSTTRFHGRFIKGDALSDLFACGGRDGLIRLWDLRNAGKAPATVACFPGQKIAQVAFHQSRLIVCSESGQMCFVKCKNGSEP